MTPTLGAYRRAPARGALIGVAPRVTVYGCDADEAAQFRAMAPRLGLAATITPAPLTDTTAQLARGSHCVSISHRDLIRTRTLLALREAGVSYISTRSVGCNHIDVDRAESIGLTVETVAYSPDSVADYTLMLMLMVLRHADAIIRRTDVHDYRLDGLRGRELRDLTVGVVGTGRIGGAVIQRLRGFGCRTLAYDIHPKIAADYVTLDALLERSDIVTLHPPLTPTTRHLLDRDRIERMKHGAVVVNTGRGALVDTEALASALERGRLGAAALDVIEGEDGIFYDDHRDKPIASELFQRLHRLPNVLIGPHAAYYTDHALRDIVENSLINCLNFEERLAERPETGERHG